MTYQLQTVFAEVTERNMKGNVIPADTFHTCCVCGEEIPESDFEAGGLHDGVTTMEDGSQRFVHRHAHAACNPRFKNLLW